LLVKILKINGKINMNDQEKILREFVKKTLESQHSIHQQGFLEQKYIRNLKKLNSIIESSCIEFCISEGLLPAVASPKNYTLLEGRWVVPKAMVTERMRMRRAPKRRRRRGDGGDGGAADPLETIDQVRKSSNYWTPGRCGDFKHTYGSVSTGLKHGPGMDHIEKYLEDDEKEAYWNWYGSCAKGVDKIQYLQAQMIMGAGGAIIDLAKSAGKGLYRILKPAIAKAGSLALDIAKDAGKLVLKSVGGALDVAWDVISDVVVNSADSAWDWMKNRGTKKDLTQLAQENPDTFIEFHEATKKKLMDAGLPASSASETASTIGLLQTDVGKETAETAAGTLGITPAQLEDLLLVHAHTFKEIGLAQKRASL